MNQLSLNLSAPKRRFYVTTRLSADDLTLALLTAKNQDDAVLAIYRAYLSFTPSQCWARYTNLHGGIARVPLTSIRRSISVLTAAGALYKTDQQHIGIYGKPEHVWELA